MKKFISLALAFAFSASLLVSNESKAWWGGDKCNPEPKCDPEPVCYGCAPNVPMKIVELEKCAKPNKPYNYYEWKAGKEKTVASDIYNWAEAPEGAVAE